MSKKRIFTGIIMAISAFLLSVCNVGAGEKTVPEITIWLDEDSEYVVRWAVTNYKWLSGSYKEWNENYPEITWNLVDKGYLSPEEFRAELERELKAGKGPDLIYMDEYNGISPRYLMESGYLMELEDITKITTREGEWSYLPGTLEAGQMDGAQYVLPVYLQYPVAFGKKEELERAGINTEEGYGSLKELLEALISSSEASGKQIFENGCMVDWLEAYAIPRDGTEEDGEAAEELKELLVQVRERCGSEDRFFSPYEALESGSSLLSGCSVESSQKLAQNLGMMEKEEEVEFLGIPAWGGEHRAVITQSAAVNANTRYPDETVALARAFQESYINLGPGLTRYYPVLEAYWEEALDGSCWSVENAYEKSGRRLSRTEKTSRKFRKCTQEAITAAVFQSTPENHTQVPEEAEEIAGKRVLTVAFADQGLGKEYSVYRWLRDAAEAYSDEELAVQLVAVPYSQGGISPMLEMERAGAGTDVLLGVSIFVEPDYPFPEEAEYYTDLTPLLENRAGLRTVAGDGTVKGISYGTSIQEEGSAVYNYIFAVSEHSKLKEEAVGFCLAALENDSYAAAVTEAGILPVE